MPFITLGIPAHSVLVGLTANNHHNQAHAPETHTGQSLTAAETDTLRNAGDAEALHSHIKTKEVIFPVTALATAFPLTTLRNDHVTAAIADTVTAQFIFAIPTTFAALVSLELVVIANATHTLQWDITTSFAAVGEANNANTDSVVDATQAVTITEVESLDISGEVTGIAAGDSVGMQFASNINSILGLYIRLRYTE